MQKLATGDLSAEVPYANRMTKLVRWRARFPYSRMALFKTQKCAKSNSVQKKHSVLAKRQALMGMAETVERETGRIGRGRGICNPGCRADRQQAVRNRNRFIG